MTRIGAILVLLSAGACGVSFPDETRIEDLRILDVTVEPPEIPILAHGTTATTPDALLDRLLDSPNLEVVRMTALVAHPDLDAEFEYTWTGCPPALLGYPCRGVERPALSASTSSVASFRPVAFLQAQLLATGDPASALAALGADPRDLLNGLYAELILATSVASAKVPADTSTLEGLKRLVIFDPSLVHVAISEARRQAAAGEVPDLSALGLPSLCTRATDEEVAAIDAELATRTPNRSPEYIGVEARVRGATLSVDRAILLEPGEVVELRGLARDGDRETYALIDDNCQLVERQETLAWSWFVNHGAISRGLTVLDDTEDEDRRWTAYAAPDRETFAQTGGRARVYSILRDGRGGSRHRVIEIELRPTDE